MSSRASSRSRSRSPASSVDDDEPRTPAQPSPPPQSAIERADADAEAPNDATQLLLLVLHGSAPPIDEFCRPMGPAKVVTLCEIEHEHEGKRGTVLDFAARNKERSVLRSLVSACGSEVERVIATTIRTMVAEARYSMVVYLMSLCPTAGLQLMDGLRGDTLLHALCRGPKVPPWCVQDVLAQYVAMLPPLASDRSPSRYSHATMTSISGSIGDPAARRLPHINRLNSKGLTALHLAATNIRGLAGGQITKMLLRHGADETILTPAGHSVIALCTNGYAREHLGIVRSRHRGKTPALDEEIKAKLDECKDSSEFPILPEIVEPPEVPTPEAEVDQTGEDGEGKRKKGAPLPQEDVDAMVQRLHDQSIRTKQQWFDERYDEISTGDQQRYHGKQLAADEVEASVSRLYQESIDKQVESMGELNTKYIKERPPGPTLEPDDLEACNNRLCKESMEKLSSIRKQLDDKFYPKKQKQRLSKDQMAASALRLCHESQAKTAKEMSDLHDEYCSTPKLRFNGGERGPLTAEQVKALGDRLSKRP